MVSDRQTDLQTMRTLLLAAITDAGKRDLPQLCRELRAVDTELEALAPTLSPEQAYVDELKDRRHARRPAS